MTVTGDAIGTPGAGAGYVRAADHKEIAPHNLPLIVAEVPH